MDEGTTERLGSVKKLKPNSINLLLLYNLLLILIPGILSLIIEVSKSPDFFYYAIFTPVAIGVFNFLIQCLFCGFITIANISRRTIIGYMLYLIIPLVLFDTVSYHGSFAIVDLITGKDHSALNIGVHAAIVLTFVTYKFFLID